MYNFTGSFAKYVEKYRLICIMEVITMVKFISYIVAVIITAIIAIILYPIAALCWIFSLIGKVSDNLFHWTNKTIKNLWNDIKNNENA